MRRTYGNRILAKARGKYGVPNYPGRKEKSVGENDEIKKSVFLKKVAINQNYDAAEKIFESIKEIIKNEIAPVSYETWIESCRPVYLTHEKLVLLVENYFHKEMLEKRYVDIFRAAARITTNQTVSEVELITKEEYTGKEDFIWRK